MFKKILEWIISLFTPKNLYFTGVLEDIRTDSEKERDYQHDERLVEAPDNIWGKKIETSPYAPENQNETSSCVAHGVTLAFSITLSKVKGYYARLSKMFVYRLRSNFPDEGMYPQNAFDILRKTGSCLYDLLPNTITETDANKITLTDSQILEAELLEGNEYYTFNKNDRGNIDILASESARGTAIPLQIFATYSEWARQYPKVAGTLNPITAEIRHEICVLPNSGFIENGIKYVAVQDSAWFGGFNLRYLSEEFIKNRVQNAGYWVSLKLLGGQGEKPKHTFSKVLRKGDKNDEVLWLQKCLEYEGCLPKGFQTGFFGSRTLAGVRLFQKKYSDKILSPAGISEPTGIVGNYTIEQLNRLYA